MWRYSVIWVLRFSHVLFCNIQNIRCVPISLSLSISKKDNGIMKKSGIMLKEQRQRLQIFLGFLELWFHFILCYFIYMFENSKIIISLLEQRKLSLSSKCYFLHNRASTYEMLTTLKWQMLQCNVSPNVDFMSSMVNKNMVILLVMSFK